MKISEFLWNEFVYGGHWFSISASSIVFSIMLILNIVIKWEFLFIIYFLMQCVYNYNHYKEIHIDFISNPDRPNHLRNYLRALPIITFFYGFLLFLLIIYFGNIPSIVLSILLLILGLSFTHFFKKLTKQIIGFKNFFASFTLGSLVIFTTLYCSHEINIFVFELFLLLSLRFVISSSISDIKDIKNDKKQNLTTFPIYFGRKKFLTFLHIINFITFIPFFIFLIKNSYSFVPFLIFTYVYTFYYIEKAKKPKINENSLVNIIVDGEFIFWPFMIISGILLI